jgi:hypothetical protein
MGGTDTVSRCYRGGRRSAWTRDTDAIGEKVSVARVDDRHFVVAARNAAGSYYVASFKIVASMISLVRRWSGGHASLFGLRVGYWLLHDCTSCSMTIGRLASALLLLPSATCSA